MNSDKLQCQSILLYSGQRLKRKQISFYNYNGVEILQIGTNVPIVLRKAYLKLNPPLKGLSKEERNWSFEIIFDKNYIIVCKNKSEFYLWITKLSFYTKNVGIIGFPLLVAIRKSKWRVPYPIFRCIEYLEKNKGVEAEGIFRMNGGTEEIERLIKLTENDQDISFLNTDNCYVVASFLKYYLINMIEPLIPFNFYNHFIQLPECSYNPQQFVNMLPQENQDSLWFLLRYLKKIAENKHINKMNEFNLSTCISLTICSIPIGDQIDLLEHTRNVVDSFFFMLTKFEQMFAEVEIRNVSFGIELPLYPVFISKQVDFKMVNEKIKMKIKKGLNKESCKKQTDPTTKESKLTRTKFVNEKRIFRNSCGDLIELLCREDSLKKEKDASPFINYSSEENKTPKKIYRSTKFVMAPNLRQRVIDSLKPTLECDNTDLKFTKKD